jgi:exonuclease family protein
MTDKEKYMCFADFEFTCGNASNHVNSEMLSVGLVICSGSYDIIEKFYQTSKPNRFPKLTKQCRELTHLTQNEIDSSDDSNNVLKTAAELMNRYSITELFVWGNFDKPGLCSDIRQHKRFKKPYRYISKVCSAVTDIQDNMTRKMELPQAVNIKELASAFNYAPEGGSFHNAFNDAMALYTIHKTVYTKDYKNFPDFIRLRQERLERMVQAKLNQEKRRIELALSPPISDEERSFYEESCKTGNESSKKEFVYTRCKILSAFRQYPDEENFAMIVFNDPKRIKVLPYSKYTPAKSRFAAKAYLFNKSETGEIVLKNCNDTELS